MIRNFHSLTWARYASAKSLHDRLKSEKYMYMATEHKVCDSIEFAAMELSLSILDVDLDSYGPDSMMDLVGRIIRSLRYSSTDDVLRSDFKPITGDARFILNGYEHRLRQFSAVFNGIELRKALDLYINSTSTITSTYAKYMSNVNVLFTGTETERVSLVWEFMLERKSLPMGSTNYGPNLDERLLGNKLKIVNDYAEGIIPAITVDPYGHFQYFTTIGVHKKEFVVEVKVEDSTSQFESPNTLASLKSRINIHTGTSSHADPLAGVTRENRRIQEAIRTTQEGVIKMASLYADAEKIRMENKLQAAMQEKLTGLDVMAAKKAYEFYLEAMNRIHDKGAFYYLPSTSLSYPDILVSKKPITLYDYDNADHGWDYGHLVLHVKPHGITRLSFSCGVGAALETFGHDLHPHLCSSEVSGLCWGNLHGKVVSAVSSKVIEAIGQGGTSGNLSLSNANLHKIMTEAVGIYRNAEQSMDAMEKAADFIKYGYVVNDYFQYTNLIWLLLSDWDHDSPYIKIGEDQYRDWSHQDDEDRNRGIADDMDYEDFLNCKPINLAQVHREMIIESGLLDSLPVIKKQFELVGAI